MAKLKVPDLIGAATTQGQLNKDAAFDVANANRYTQVGPEGSSNAWNTDPTTGAVTNTTTMGARPQAYYNALMDTGTGAVNSFASKYYGGGGGAPAGGGGGISINLGGGGGGGSSAGPSPVGKGIMKDVDYSALTGMPTTDPAAARQEAQDALYGRSKGYLDPQWQEAQRATEAQLVNKGYVPGTEAYDNAYANMSRAKEAAYTGARQDAIAGGGLEAQRAQAMALELRRQGMSEADAKFAAHNAAQGQGANQWLTQHGQDTSANAQIQSAGLSAGASMANAQLANQLGTRQQEFYEMMGMGKGAQDFLPQFGISQGNVAAYKPADIYGATQQTFEDQAAAQKAKKPGLFSQLLPIAGTIAGSFAGNPALGSMLGTAAAKGVG